jgi:hypothetical protein
VRRRVCRQREKERESCCLLAVEQGEGRGKIRDAAAAGCVARLWLEKKLREERERERGGMYD